MGGAAPLQLEDDDTASHAGQAQFLAKGRRHVGHGGPGKGLLAAKHRRVARRILGRRLDADPHLDLRSPAPNGEFGGSADAERGDAEPEALGVGDLVAVDGEHHVADAEAAPFRRPARVELVDQYTARPAHAERGGDVGRNALPKGAEPRPNHAAIPGDAGDHRAHHVRRYGEANAHGTAGLGKYGGIDADQPAIHGDQRAARVAGIDGGIGLDEGVEVRNPHLGARQGGDDAAGHGLADAEGVSDGEHQVADLELVGIAKFEIRQRLAARVDAQNGQVRAFVGADDDRLVLAAVGEHDGNLVGALDDVVVGDDEALGADDDAGPQRVLYAPAGRVQPHSETFTEEAAEEGIVEQRGELARARDLAAVYVDDGGRRPFYERGIRIFDLRLGTRRALFRGRRRGRRCRSP